MIYIVIILFGIGAFIITFLYQQIFVTKMSFVERILFFFILTGIIITSAYIRLQYVEKGTLEANILGPIASPIQKSVEVVREARESKELQKVVLPLIEQKEGTYAVSIKNLKTGGEYHVNDSEQFASASLYKLWVMGTVYKQIKDGKLTLNQTLSIDVPTLNKRFNISTESAEMKEGTITYTVKNALEQMITISHNYAALLLTATVKLSNIQNFLNSYKLTDSHMGTPPKTTTRDILSFYELLYNGELVDKTSSDEMLEILKRQKLNDRIPKYLPGETVVAHKTGEFDGVKHDAGIVYSSKGDYIIVLMSDTESEVKAAEVEAKISKAVWEYFNR